MSTKYSIQISEVGQATCAQCGKSMTFDGSPCIFIGSFPICPGCGQSRAPQLAKLLTVEKAHSDLLKSIKSLNASSAERLAPIKERLAKVQDNNRKRAPEMRFCENQVPDEFIN